MRDTAACLDWLAADPRVKGEAVGVTGYCMGGGIAFRAAAAFPERIAAAASFHGGNLATDAVGSSIEQIYGSSQGDTLTGDADRNVIYGNDGVDVIKTFVVDCVLEAGGKTCPPTIVGVGVGGTADLCLHLAKRAATRPLGTVIGWAIRRDPTARRKVAVEWA